MNNNKLIRVFNSLTAEEVRLFKRLLESKMFNQNAEVLALFNYLRFQTARDKPRLTKEQVHNKLFPGTPYKEKHIRDIISYLFKALEKFLSLNEYYNDNGRELLDLCKAYRKRSLPKLFETSINKANKLIENGKRDVEYHEYNFRLQWEEYQATFVRKGRTKANNLQQVSDRLDINYFANRLRQCCIMLSHQSVYNINYDMGLVNDVIREVKRKELLHIPAISIYYYGYLALTNIENLQYFKALQKSLNTSVELFDINEMKDIYLLAINIGIKNLNRGNLEFISVLLEIYKSGVENRILLTNDKIGPFTYKNITALALRVKQFDWAEEFINNFRHSIESSNNEALYSYNLAKLNYEKKEYEEALSLLLNTSSTGDLYVSLDIKILRSRIYYEQKDLDALQNVVESFKIFIRRSKIISYHKTSYSNFLNCLVKLIATNPYDKEEKSKLQSEIEELQPLPDKYWFLQQLK